MYAEMRCGSDKVSIVLSDLRVVTIRKERRGKDYPGVEGICMYVSFTGTWDCLCVCESGFMKYTDDLSALYVYVP